jgi:Domain of unknown function DUF29
VRAGEAVDREHVAEELEDLGRQARRELRTHFTILMTHMLKRQYQPHHHTRSWDLTIKAQRLEVQKLLKDMPSLQATLNEIMSDAYGAAVIHAAQETRELVESDFPAQCPWTAEEILADL